MLDAGCGTGGLLTKLAQRSPKAFLYGLDVESVACRFARDKSGAAVVQGSADSLPFPDGALSAIFSVDVLCHRAVDQQAAMAEAHRCLGPGGLFLINLPAFEWMRSDHDERVHTARRYTKSDVHALLRQAGFGEVRAFYWNSLLFPIMVLRRKLFRPRHGESDVRDYPPLVDGLFRLVTGIERAALGLGLRLPFGGSVLAVAVKHG